MISGKNVTSLYVGTSLKVAELRLKLANRNTPLF